MGFNGWAAPTSSFVPGNKERRRVVDVVVVVVVVVDVVVSEMESRQVKKGSLCNCTNRRQLKQFVTNRQVTLSGARPAPFLPQMSPKALVILFFVTQLHQAILVTVQIC